MIPAWAEEWGERCTGQGPRCWLTIYVVRGGVVLHKWAYATDDTRRVRGGARRQRRARTVLRTVTPPEGPTSEYPYRTDAIAALHPDGWASISPQAVAVEKLVPTQADVSLARLQHHAHGGAPETGDPHPHVILYGGRAYLHDGHHRYAVALLRGGASLACRVVDDCGLPVDA